MKKVQVQMISDFMSPWCWIGKRTLELAAVEAKVDIHFNWYPFQIEPALPTAGIDKKEWFQREMGDEAAERYLHGSGVADAAADGKPALDENGFVKKETDMERLGRELDLPFRYIPGSRISNTFHAHRLVYAAGQLVQGNLTPKGELVSEATLPTSSRCVSEETRKASGAEPHPDPQLQTKIVEVLFRKYHSEGANLGDASVLIDAAASSGMDSKLTELIVKSARFYTPVTQSLRQSHAITDSVLCCAFPNGTVFRGGVQTKDECIQALTKAEPITDSIRV